MSKIKVHQISYLEDYVTGLTAFAEHYRTDFEAITQHFTSGLSDEKGAAINAFFTKLATLQSQIFTTYPAAIDTCASVIRSYVTSLRGAGFNEVCWSNSEGIDSVKQVLTESQITTIETVRSGLASLMDSAASEAGIASLSGDLNPIKTQAETDLDAAASTRGNKHSEVDAAFTAFLGGLDTANADLSAANALIRNATLVSTIPAKTILKSIMNGHLTAEEMYYLDALTNSSDVELIEVLLSEGDYESTEAFFKALGEVDATDASLMAVSAVYGRILEEIPTEEAVRSSESGIALTNVEAFLIALSGQDKKAASSYLTKLVQAGAQTAGLLKAGALALVPEFSPPGSSQEQYQSYWDTLSANQRYMTAINAELKRAGLLADIFTIAYVENIGETEHSVPYETRTHANFNETIPAAFKYTTFSTIVKGSLVLKEDKSGTVGVGFSIYSLGEKMAGNGISQTRAFNSVNYYNQAEFNLSKTNDRVKELMVAKQEALDSLQVEFIVESATLGIDLVAESFMPGWSIAFGVVNSLSKDKSDVVQGLGLSKELLSGAGASKKFSDKTSSTMEKGAKTAEFLSSIVNYFDKVKAIEKSYEESIALAKEQELKDKEAIIFDYGGSHVTVKGEKATNYSYLTPEYDLESSLQIYDMEQNGLRAQVFRDAAGSNRTVTSETIEAVTNFDNAIGDPRNNAELSESTRKFFAGDSGLSVSDIGIEGINEGLDEIQGGIKGGDMPTKSQTIKNTYFEDYVRGQQ